MPRSFRRHLSLECVGIARHSRNCEKCFCTAACQFDLALGHWLGNLWKRSIVHTHTHTKENARQLNKKNKQNKLWWFDYCCWRLVSAIFLFCGTWKCHPLSWIEATAVRTKKFGVFLFFFFFFFCLDKMSSPIVIVMLLSQEGSFLYFFLPSCFYFLFCFVFFSPATQVDSDRKTRVSVHWCKQGSCNASYKGYRIATVYV